MYQKTIRNIIEISGIGVHSGMPARIRILPSPEDTGISFLRKDIRKSPIIKAESRNVVTTSYATTIGRNGVTVSTVEHLMSAFYGLGVDNAVIEVYGPEIPVLDGSARGFVEFIESVGLKTLGAEKRYMLVKKPIKILEGDKFICLEPAGCGETGLVVDYTINFSHPHLNEQRISLSITSEVFKNEITDARTFGFLRDVEMLKENGLARGGSLENAVVIGDDGIINQDGLRYPDEFVRHKVLDLIGDISLLGAPIIGRVRAIRGGHSLNQKLVSEVLNRARNWEMVGFTENPPAGVFSHELATA